MGCEKQGAKNRVTGTQKEKRQSKKISGQPDKLE